MIKSVVVSAEMVRIALIEEQIRELREISAASAAKFNDFKGKVREIEAQIRELHENSAKSAAEFNDFKEEVRENSNRTNAILEELRTVMFKIVYGDDVMTRGSQAAYAIQEQNNETVCQTDAQQRQLTEMHCDNKGKTQPTDVQEHSRAGINIEVIELSDDEENENPNVPEVLSYDLESYMWYYRDPQGEVQGPFCLNSLKRWDDGNYFPPGFKIWKMGQSQREAELLSDVLRQSFSVN